MAGNSSKPTLLYLYCSLCSIGIILYSAVQLEKYKLDDVVWCNNVI